MTAVKDIQQIKLDYEIIINDLENLINSVIQKYREEVESEINTVCVQVTDDDNSTKLQVIVVTPKDLLWFEKYKYKSADWAMRPSRIVAKNIRAMIGNETEDFIVRYVPEFWFYKRYDGE